MTSDVGGSDNKASSRTILRAVGLAVVAGIVIGSLLALETPATDLIAGSRLLTILVWILLSLVCAVPVALAMSSRARRAHHG